MAVNLSPVFGVAGQLFDNNGNPLAGGKIFTYLAGTTTPAPTYTSSNGAIAHSNPIVLDGAGRVPSGEIWLTDGIQYKFVVEDAANNLIGTYDNLTGINSNFVAFTAQQEIQTATAGQTVFNLTTMQYQPATNNLSVFVDGVNQYGPGAQYAYVETDSNTVTFVSGLHVGASVKFTTASPVASSATDAENVSYTPPFSGSITTNVENKLAQTVSVKDFGATGDGVTNDTLAIQAAIAYVNSVGGGKVLITDGMRCVIDGNITISASVSLEGPHNFVGSPGDNAAAPYNNVSGAILLNSTATITLSSGASISGLLIYRKGMTFPASNGSLFAGTAITIDGDDCCVDRSMILGFAKAIYSDNSQRPKIQNVLIDCSAGIEITNCFDIARLHNVHCWPFASIAAAGTLVKTHRSGSAFYLHDSVDGPMLTNCFAYGYLNGFYFKNVSTVAATNCFADNTNSSVQYVNSVGWRFEGNINGFESAGCAAWSCDNGIVVDVNSGQFVSVQNYRLANHTFSGISVLAGIVDVVHNYITGCFNAVSTASNSTVIRFEFNSLASISSAPIVSSVSTINIKIGENNYQIDALTGSYTNSNTVSASLASADPLQLPKYTDTFNVTGTTGFGNLGGGWAGRKVTLVFSGVLTVFNGTGTAGSMRLNAAANFTSAANSTLTLCHNGTQWYEIGRSA